MIGTSIEEATTYLSQNQVIGVPTETVYGLAANAYAPRAIKKIYAIKQRPYTKPLNVVIQKTAHIHNVAATFPPRAQQLATVFWPGPLTLLLPKAKTIPNILTNNLPTVGVRVTSHTLLRALLANLFPNPLAIPSANISGHLSPTSAQQVAATLGKKLPYILDGGPSPIGLESTIIGDLDQPQPTIFRLGAITIPQIEKIIGNVRYRPQTTPNICNIAPSTIPQQIHTPLYLGNITQLLAQHKNKKIGLLSFNSPVDNIPPYHQICLSPKGDIAEAAHNLYAALHKLDQMNLDLIIAPIFPNTGLGKSINERLLIVQQHH